MGRAAIAAVICVSAAVGTWSAPRSSAQTPSGVSIATIGSWTGETSLALSPGDSPVIAFQQYSGGSLRGAGFGLTTCSDPGCAGPRTNVVVNGASLDYVGTRPSLELDAAGRPVASYTVGTGSTVRLTRCSDSGCSHEVAYDGCATSSEVQLDAADHPVIAAAIPGFCDGPGGVMLEHCNDATCRGGDESIVPFVTAESDTQILTVESLVLDRFGNPVVLNHEHPHELTLVHCNDPNCAGGDESEVTFGSSALGSSLVLDVAGNPVIATVDTSDPAGGRLRVVHCNDPDCAGGDESIAVVDHGSSGGVGPTAPSMALDHTGHPVIAYHDKTTDRLAVVRCNDPNCDGDDESIAIIDAPGGIPSLALDSGDRPVLSYSRTMDAPQPFALIDTELRIARCLTPDCSPDNAPTPTVPTPTDPTVPTSMVPTPTLPATGLGGNGLIFWGVVVLAFGTLFTAIAARR